MSPALNQEIARLSPPERLALIGELWDSLDRDDVPMTVAQDRELDRRLDMLDKERKHAISWEVVKADLGALTRN